MMTNRISILAGVLVLLPWTLSAQSQELGLTLGGLLKTDRTGPGANLTLGAGTALEANYGIRIGGLRGAALFGEVQFLANPQRLVTSENRLASRDVATLFVTPGLRLKFFPRRTIAPYLAAGAGYALFEHSVNRLDGQPNGAPRTAAHGVFDFGGGADFKVWRFVSLRAEIRDFYSGSPSYNLPVTGSGQHNVVAGGGIVLRFGKE